MGEAASPEASPSEAVTSLLDGAGRGEPRAAAALLPLIYDHLRELARARMAAERADHTLQPTALVHEAYLRLIGGAPARWAGRAHFFHAAAEAMRRILIDHARGRARVKRGGGGGEGAAPPSDGAPAAPARRARRIPLNLLDLAAEPESEEILALDEAIRRLGEESSDAAAVVKLRYYGGLSVDETAETLGVSSRTVNREWAYARAWLYRHLTTGES